MSSATKPAPPVLPPSPISGDTPTAADDADRPVPWAALAGFAFVIVVFFAAQLVSELLISIYPLLKHWSEAQADAWVANSTAVKFAYNTLSDVLIMTAVVLFLRRYKVGFSALKLKKPQVRDPLFGVLAIPIYYLSFAVILAGVTAVFPHLNVDQKQELGFDNISGTLPLVLTFITLVVLPPLVEETLFRGLMYSSLKKGLPTALAVIITSLLFGAGHLLEGGNSGLLYVGALQTFTLSLVLLYLREKTGSLWAGITLHASNNLIAFISLYVLHAK